MSHNNFRRHLAVPALGAALLAFGSGCGDSVGPTVEPGPDLTTVQGAIFALEDHYSRRQAEEAIALLAPDYTFTPALPESIPFLAMGETTWDYDQETAILNEMLVPEMTSWLDQVLLEITAQTITRNADSSDVVVEAEVELSFLIGSVDLVQSQSEITMKYRRDSEGNYRLYDEVEALSLNPDTMEPWKEFTVGELRAQSLEDPLP
ncbi:MAG TPA: hypothetical protein VKU85_10570 [bacterium]|nr:hypothetical protein [bacterium]